MKAAKTPEHIGIILDGNRRFAKRLMLNPWKGHEHGAKKVEKLVDWAIECKIKELTLNYSTMINTKIEYLESIAERIEKPLVQKCPKCDGLLTKKNGKFGQFYGCSSYPTCRFTIPIR